MSESVTIGRAKLYLGDCREVLPTLPKVDAVVTDPPYGMDRANSGHSVIARLGGVIADNEPFDPRPFLVGQSNVFWGANHYASRLPDGSRWLAWVKHDPGLFAKRSTSSIELAWTDLGGSLRAIKHIWDGSIKEGESAGSRHVHPTEKPVEVMSWCLGFLPSAETILDPFMGSGTTGVAAVRMGKSFIGVEIDPQHFATACKRIEDAQRQGDMFIGEAA